MTAARKFVIAMLAIVALLAPATAHGAQYTVHACGDGENNSFFAAASDKRMSARSLCAADAQGQRLGVAVLSGVGQGTVPVFANATQSFLAPPGTTIAHVHLKADARTANGDWAALLQASTDRFSTGVWNIAGCSPRPGDAAACNAATTSVAQNYDLPGATGFRSVVACGNFAGCGTFTTSTWPFSRAYYLMHQADVASGGNPFTPWLTATTQTSANYFGDAGGSYRFRVRAIDAFGNTSPFVESAAATISRRDSRPQPPVIENPPPTARSPELRLTTIRRGRSQIIVRGTVARGAAGRVTAVLKRQGRRIAKASTHARHGAFALRIKVPHPTTPPTRGILVVSYLGGSGYAAESRRVAIRGR